MNSSRFVVKVTFLLWTLPDGAELATYRKITQLLLASVQCLWVYDYLITFGDEVRPLSSDGFYPNCPLDAIHLVRKEVRGLVRLHLFYRPMIHDII